MTLLRCALAILPLILCCACTSMVPRENLPYPLATEESADMVKVVSLPLPVIAASPNEGVTSGALAAFLVHNRRDEVTSLVAPQINFNPNFGTTLTLYGAFYPTASRSVEFNLSHSTRVNDDYEMKLRDVTLLKGRLELNAFLYHFTDGSSRFYGFESSSTKDGETNYANREDGFTVTATWPLYKHTSLQVGERLRKVGIGRGAIDDVPYIKDRFTVSEVPGLNGFTTHAQKLALVYSTLDSPTIPSYGGSAKISVEGSMRFLGSDENYRHYEVEAKGFVPADSDKRYITAFRGLYNQTLGEDVPFLERSILGGENTMRAFGRNRFIDSSCLLFNLEERIRLFRWEVFDVTADWEVAPFLDTGAVMKSLSRVRGNRFEFNPGVGLRAVVRPNIVGRMDIGWGKEGVAVFVGLGYPF
ncbi:MAG TPA: BamA/TamA family outer membrane protein [Geobacteraceae bacterium]|nr:BamA/TamA family outer membrane protein [Geobacteraceae bacterium]